MFGHPRSLFVLFFAEMWERFSFYGMKALLILYMVNYLVWNQEHASSVMAWYAGLVYCTPLLGGILADKVFGARWAVVIGGVLMAIGHFLLAFEPMPCFFAGLGFLIAGCGLLKPNISTQVGSMYLPDDTRRDSAFTIFYMGINLGAFIGPLVCDWLRSRYGFHYGFAAAGVGMVVGLIVYLLGMKSVMVRVAMVATGKDDGAVRPSTATPSANVPPRVRIDRIIVLLVIFLFVIVFWTAFEQAANVMTIWADKHTNLHIFRTSEPEAVIGAETAISQAPASWRDLEIGAGQLQCVNPFFVITLAALFAWFWIWLDKRRKQPSTPVKMTLGMLGMTLAYGVMLLAAQRENQPSSAPLADLPGNVDLSQYGSTRLHHDPRSGTLRMNGVLTDLDWLRLLAESAPKSYRENVDELVSQAQRQADRPGAAEAWKTHITLSSDSPDPVPVGPLPDTVTWNATERTLTTTAAIPERDRLRLLAAAAQPTFRDAVTAIYRQSSLHRVTVLWLVLFYFVCTLGELCLSPVGLSLVTKLAPPKHVGLMMGLWFLMTGGVANFVAHKIGGGWGTMTPTAYFLIFGAVAAVAALLMIPLVGLLRRMMHGVQ